MATKQEALVYEVTIPDATLLDELVAAKLLNPEHYEIEAPNVVAVKYYDLLVTRGTYPAQPPPVNALPILVDPTDPATNPGLRSPWFTHTPPQGEDPFPLDKPQFTRRSGGWFGIGWLFGQKTLYSWYAHYTYVPPLTVGTGTPGAPVKVPMPLRHWIDGAELPLQGEGASGGTVAPSRRASRHAQGFGYHFDSTSDTRTHSHTENGGTGSNSAWERCYLRVLRFPDAPVRIWRNVNSSSQQGALITLTSAGALLINHFDGFSAVTPAGSIGTLKIHTWYKLDLLYKLVQVSPGPPPVIMIDVVVYLNGTRTTAVQLGPSPGLAATWTQSIIGGGGAPSGTVPGIWQLDDWIGGEYPPPGYDVGSTNDFIKGSRVALIGATGFGVNHGAWTGDWRLTRQRPVTIGVPSQLTSNVSGALLSVTTDAGVEIDGQPNQMGIAALTVALYSDKGGGGASGQLGYGFNGAAATLSNITQGFGGYSWANVLYKGGTIAPLAPMAGLELTHQKGASTDPAKVQALQAVGEILGVFGDEDVYPNSALGVPIADPATNPITQHIGIHNAAYPHTAWAQTLLAPQSPIVIKAGQYTGNGTGQDLTFRAPVHFLWIRPMSGGSGGVQWWPSLSAAHIHGMKAYAPDTILEVLMDPTFVGGTSAHGETDLTVPPPPDNLEQAIAESNQLAYGFHKNDESYEPWTHYLEDPAYYWGRMLGDQAQGGPDQAVAGAFAVPPSPWFSTQQQQTLVRVAGSQPESNAAGVVYSYVAFSDPGMRFSNAGALGATQLASDYVSPLDVEQFTPETAFLLSEEDVAATTQTLMFKGLGSAPTAVSLLTLAELASALQFGTGTLTYKPGLATPNPTVNQHAYLVFRRDDKSGDPGIPKVLWLATYVGDGGGVRTINVAPSGVRPLWAIVVGHNGTAFMRDPYHTGTTSTQFPNTANASTGIIEGGIDYIKTGSALNANGVIYDVLVFPGGTAACNNGWSCPGEFVPVDPRAPTDGPWGDPGEPVEPPGPDGPGGGDDPGGPYPPGPPPAPWGTQCVAASTLIVNQALSRIGVTKQVGDVVTENTIEAALARLHYQDDCDTVLRDFAWPFATHYATLAVVAGPAPVAAPDWRYAYRRPSDCVFERRIWASRGGGVDPTPPPFQLGSDATGGLIYSNTPSAVLEYTARPACAAGVGDPLFKDALTWRHAASLAPGLSRMADITNLCLTKYQTALALAFAVLRPGNPGQPVLAATIDTAPAAAAANVALVNRALLRIGAQTITNLTTDQSRGAVAVRAIFEAELQSVLRDFAWPFATRYQDPLVLVAGTVQAPVNADWTYSYRLPLACVMARRLVSPTKVGRAWDPDPPKFRTGTDATGGLLFTHLEAAVLEYTARLDGAVLISDHVFQEALAWRLAAALAPSLAQADPEGIEQVGRGPDDPRTPKVPRPTAAQLRQRIADGAWQQYHLALNVARAAAMKEQQQFPDGPAPWITARGDGWRTRGPGRP